MILVCQKCQGPMEIDDATVQGMLAAGQAVTMNHDVCPPRDGELPQDAPRPARPADRFFEARLDLVEVFPDRKESEEIASFRASATAPTASAALGIGGPVMSEFAAKWEKLAPSFGFADMPVRDQPWEPREVKEVTLDEVAAMQHPHRSTPDPS